MRNDRRLPPSSRQSGFSLAEVLTVVAIIGVMSLAAVPAFITMMQTSRMKTALRQFTGDLRGARSHAASRYRWVKVQIEVGVTPGRYIIEESADFGDTWTTLREEELVEPISFLSTTFEDSEGDEGDDDELPEIIIRNNGTIDMGVGVTSREIVLKTTANISKPSITVTAKPTGKITAE